MSGNFLLADVALEIEGEGLVDQVAIDRAMRAVIVAKHRQLTAQVRAEEAEVDLDVARQINAGLISRVAGGEALSLEQVINAQESVRELEAYATFLATVARSLSGPLQEAEQALARAKDLAWQPVLRRGQEVCIEAAAKCDRARLLGQRGADTAPADVARIEEGKAKIFADARKLYDWGSTAIELACGSGAEFDLRKRVDRPTWPSSEQRERDHWGIPLQMEDVSNAA